MDPTTKTVLKQRIHTALLEIFKQRLVRDSDGDWPIHFGDRVVYIRLEQDPAPHAFVFTRAASHISRDCVGELNDLNVVAAWAKFVRTPGGGVFVTQRVHQKGITAGTLRHAIAGVATCAEKCGPMLQTVYGEPAEVTRDDLGT